MTIIAKRIPGVRLVFDRKHAASKTKKGLVQIEITLQMKRKWVSTSVKLYKDQWDDRKHVVKSTQAVELNEFLNRQVSDLEKWLRSNLPFSWEKLDKHLKEGDVSDNFIDFVEKSIKERNDITESTKKSHKKLVNVLDEYGKIKFFSDLTRAGILDFDNWLHGRKVRKLDKQGIEHWEPMRQQSLYDFHKIMKIYINRAVQRGLINANPYAGQHFKRGESEPDRYLTEDELHQLEAAEMRNGSIARAKDLFIFQCYTGLSYSDLRLFDFTKVKDADGEKLYSGKRKKTGEVFYFILLPKAVGVLEKHDFKLPVISNEGLNQNLKKVAEGAGLDVPLSTHWARRTAAMIFANHGVPMEVVAKILGHSNTLTTQKFYADITGETVAREMSKLKKAGL